MKTFQKLPTDLYPTNKSELKSFLTSDLGTYNFFKGRIRKDDKYACVWYYYTGHNLTIQITYFQIGEEIAIETASYCGTAKGAVSKISKFLNLK